MRRSTLSDVIGSLAENRLFCIELLSAVRGVYRLDKDKTVVATMLRLAQQSGERKFLAGDKKTRGPQTHDDINMVAPI